MKGYRIWAIAAATLGLLAGCGGSDSDNGSASNEATTSNSTTATSNGTAISNGTTATSNGTTSENSFEKMIEALGGQEALTALASLEITASGEQYLFGEGFEAVVEDHLRGSFTSTLVWDVSGGRLRQDWESAIDNFGFPVDLSYREVVWGDRGIVRGCDSVFTLCSGQIKTHRQHAIRKHQYLINPHILVQKALADPTVLTMLNDEEVEGVAYNAVAIVLDGVRFKLLSAPDTGEIVRASTDEIEPILGDTTIEARFLNWRTSAESLALLFPERVETRANDLLISIENERSVVVNPVLSDDNFTDAEGAEPSTDEALNVWGNTHAHWIHRSASAGVPFDGVQTDVQTIEVIEGSGVYFFTGSHGTMAVEQENGIVVIEAPLHERRMNAVLEAIDALWPSKPITHIIATHHHYDHSGGVRALVARGAELVISEHGQPFFAKLLDAPHTISPDALHNNPSSVVWTLVPDNAPVVIGDGERRVEVRHIVTPHAKDMVIVYIPHVKTLFQSDLYVPGELFLNFPSLQPFTTNARLMLDELERFDLDIEIIAGGHGDFVDWPRAMEHILAQAP